MRMAEKRFLLVYGSQTGQAQAISEEIRDRAVEKGFQPDIHCLSQADKKVSLTPQEGSSTVILDYKYDIYSLILRRSQYLWWW